MAHAGEVIENPVTGERVVFCQTARDTGGELLQFDHYLKVNGIGPYEHFHPRQHERFRVVSGTMGAPRRTGARPARGGGDHRPVGGEAHMVERQRRGAAPDHGVPTRAEVRGVHEHPLRPRTGGAYKSFPAAAQLAVLAVECKDNVYLARYPLQKAVYRLLMPAARLLGYHARYRRHST